MPSPADDLTALLDLSYVRDAELDEGTLNLTLHHEGKTHESTLILPEEYPKGEATSLCSLGAMLSGNLSELALGLFRLAFNTDPPGCGAMEEDGDGDEEEEGDEDWDGGEDSSDGEGDGNLYPEISSRLTADLFAYEKRFGPYVLSEFPQLDKAEVSMLLTLDDLDRLTASAWGAESTVPITLALTVARSNYTHTPGSFSLQCSQAGKEVCPLAGQLENIGNYFLKEVLNGAEPETDQELPAPGSAASASAPSEAPATTPQQDEMLANLTGMGFPFEECRLVIHHTDDVGTAIELLSSGVPLKPKEEEPATGFAKPRSIYEPPVRAPAPKKKKGSWLFGKSGSESTNNPAEQREANAEYMESRVKSIPPNREGLLVQLVVYLKQRLTTCNDFCVLCDRTHMFGSGGMLKPAVCSRDLCAFAFQELSVGKNAAEEIATEAGVMDLLVTLARAAAISDRCTKVLNPFPQVPHPRKNTMALNPSSPDYNKVKEIMNKFPPPAKLASADGLATLREEMDKTEPLAFPLLQWIVNSNRSYLVKLRDDMRLPLGIDTPHQYLMVTAPPEKMAEFNRRKRRNNSVFAFHGSPIENWHSIMRTGLKNASGTGLQLHGAACGSGIYMATLAGTAYGYANRGTTRGFGTGGGNTLGNKFIDSDSGVVCLALLEIISGSQKDHGSCWTVSDEEDVLTRCFFVCPQRLGAPTANAADDGFRRRVEQIMTHYAIP